MEEKMNKIVAVITTTFLLICFSSVNTHASEERLEGILIGAGVTILGAAIINEMNHDRRPVYNHYHTPPPVTTHVYVEKRRPYYPKKQYKRHHRPRGHYEVERTWVEPVYERKWNPGHYNRRGCWVEGRYEKFLIQEGYWAESKVWVWH
jgi:hypothetical protein